MRLYKRARGLIAPGVRFSQLQYEDELARVVQPGIIWLDVGCGHGVLPPWRAEEERRLVARAGTLVGIDLDWTGLKAHPNIRCKVFGDAGALPFPAASFDLVTANMVVEHLPEPELQFREVARVLRPGGRFVFHTPNARGYLARISRLVPERAKPLLIRVLEQRRAEDVFPTFYRANTAARIHELAAATGLGVEVCRHIVTDAQLARILPLAVLELVFIRQLFRPSAEGLRPNLIAALRKPETVGAGAPKAGVRIEPASAGSREA